jgi:hypothetical protein
MITWCVPNKETVADKQTINNINIVVTRFWGGSQSDDNDHEHVDGVKLCLWTAANNGLIIHPPGVHEHEERGWNNVHWGKHLIRSTEVSGNPTNSHLAATQEKLEKEIMNFVLKRQLLTCPPEVPGNTTKSSSSNAGGTGKGNYEFSLTKYLFQWSLKCRKTLQYGADGFTSPPKEVVLRIVIVLKTIVFGRVWTREPWVQWQTR